MTKAKQQTTKQETSPDALVPDEPERMTRFKVIGPCIVHDTKPGSVVDLVDMNDDQIAALIVAGHIEPARQTAAADTTAEG